MLRKLAIISVIVSVALVLTALSMLSDELAVAKPQSKVHFTKTITSSQDPGVGQGSYEFALVLSPNQGSLYTGSLTYTASEAVEVVVLHELDKTDDGGQPTWTVDDNTIYAMSVIEPSEARSFDFTGAAIAFRSQNPFTVTTSVDGWIRGQPAELVIQKLEIKEKSLSLPDAHIPVTIPMKVGFFGKDSVYYILTDSSNKTLAEKITEKQGWPVQFAPKLRWSPASSQDTIYVFTNGVTGDGIHGFQGEVFSSTPAQTESYSPLRTLVSVSWKEGQNPQILDSAEDILKAEKDSRIKLVSTNVTINAPQVAWPGGQLFVRNETTLSNETFEKGQVIGIDRDTKKVTFVAHRGWGFDGRTIYYIIPDATPKGPADLMGIPVSPKLANVLSGVVFADMYQFKNGFKGPGQLGFQASIISSKLDESYVPICRVSIVEWKEPASALVLETISDINKKKSDGSIFVTLARPLSDDHVVNCPLVELTEQSNNG